MSRARQTGVVSPDSRLNPVQHSFLNNRAGNVSLGNTIDGFAHGPVIVPGRNDQVDFSDLAVRIGPIVVDQGTPWSFDQANTFAFEFMVSIEDVFSEDIRVV